jgi:hypothetical protein
MTRSILHIDQILAWADAHRERTGKWPDQKSGCVWEDTTEKWGNINQALHLGLRGLRPGNSLAGLLSMHRGKRNRKALAHYTIPLILRWADAHHARHGQWPRRESGPVAGTRGETWCAVHKALASGQRGLPGGSSLAQLLAEHRNVFNVQGRPQLTIKQILTWADEFKARSGSESEDCLVDRRCRSCSGFIGMFPHAPSELTSRHARF